jgi:cell surface protein SprA
VKRAERSNSLSLVSRLAQFLGGIAALVLLFALRGVGASGPKPEGGGPAVSHERGEAVAWDHDFAAAMDDSTDLRRQSQEGKLSRRAKALQRRLSRADTAAVGVDTTARVGSILSLPRDSTARLENFQYVRRDQPYAGLPPSSPYPLFLRTPDALKYAVVLDTVTWSYRIRETINNVDVKVPVDYSFDAYRSVRLQATMRKNWETLAHQYTIEGDKKKGLSELFGQVTNIEIPVPKNPIFSVFGPNKITLQINGSVDVHGAFRSTQSDVVTSNPLDQVRNEPDFNQEVQVGVRGEIGDKLKIDADWNTQRQFEYENQLKVKYTGYPDEIIQSIEAGNVSLATNSTFISSSQALFGIKAGLQMGPLKLTALASQKKGQIKELSVSGGGRPQPFEKRATDYSTDHYFIDVSYRPVYEAAVKTIPLEVDPNVQIYDIEVWVSTREILPDEKNRREAVAFIDKDTVLKYQDDLNARQSGQFTGPKGQFEEGTFVKLQPTVDYVYDEYLGYVSLNTTLQQDQAIAVAYSLPGPASGIFQDIGNFDAKDTSKTLRLVLKLVKPKYLDPSMTPAWDMMLKNIYRLGGRGIKKEGFSVAVEYLPPSGDPLVTIADGRVNLMELLRLDRYSESGERTPDNKFDYFPYVTMDESRGEIIFPTLQPFGDNIETYFTNNENGQLPADAAERKALADQYVFPELYDTTYNGAINSPKNRFRITGSIVSSVADNYNIGFNVVEGSVEVIVDGERKVAGVDYTVDYLTGQVVIKNQSLLVPGKNIQIKYEANDLFQLASKSLLGARGELSLGKTGNLGFTVMNLNQETLSDKVRLGEEPVSNTIFGTDLRTSFETPFITSVLNLLPGIRTNAASSLTLNGEVAYMLPDPNTRKSTIQQDGGQGIAYVDDFEGARRIIPFGVSYGAWHEPSPPAFMLGLDPYIPVNGNVPIGDATVQSQLLPDTVKMEYKTKTSWYNVLPSDIDSREIWPDRQTRSGESQVTALNVRFQPQLRGTYNHSLNLGNILANQRTRTWGGVMKLLGTTATNLVDENVSFIEFWIKVEKTRPTAVMRINLGFVSEDVIPNRRLDTEDGLGGTYPTGIINNPDVQDVGIDALNDDQERQAYANFIALYPEYNGDPSGDNYIPVIYGSLNPDDYRGGNGPQGNFTTESGRFADTEDLNTNKALDRTTSYFEYEISLDTANADFKRYVTGGGTNQWYQVRIPINEYVRTIGEPTLTNVEGIRLWFTGADDEILFRLVEFNLVGNQWEPLIKNDDTLRVSVVNIEDNPYYTSPPGVSRPTDYSRADQPIEGNEQSLALLLQGLQDGQVRRVKRNFAIRPLDVFNYRVMKMFVHGDDGSLTQMNYIDSTNYDVEMFLRFGADSGNYYEYRSPVRPGWDPANEINIRFSDITALKLGRDSVGGVSVRIPVPDGPPGASYQVRGSPTLTGVRYIEIGIENPVGKGATSVTGEVWVNELRLTDVDDTPGWAYRVDGTIKFADLGSLSMTLTQRDPFFHSLEDHFGTRNIDRSWSLNTNLAFERFLPTSWNGTNLQVSYSHVENLQNPRYVPGTDILVDEASTILGDLARQRGATEQQIDSIQTETLERSRTINVSETFSMPNFRVNVPVSTWLISETINRISMSFSYTTSRRRNPTTEYFEQWSWSFRFGYALQLSPANYISPFAFAGDFLLFRPFKGVKLFFTPRNISFTTSFSRAQTQEKARAQTIPKPIGRNFVATRGMSFGWPFMDGGFINPSFDYQVDIGSSLVHLEVDEFGHQRSFSEILGDIFGGPDLVNYGIDQNLSQNFAVGTKLTMPKILNLDRLVTPSARYNVRYNWNNNFQAGPLGKSAGWSSTLTLGLDVVLKAIGNEIWGSPTPARQAAPGDSTAPQGPRLFERLDALTRLFIKIPFFDFDRISFSFTQTNTSRNSGTVGGSGVINFWKGIIFLPSSPESGPSAAYQLGLITDPHGSLIMKSKSTFPFVDFDTAPGLRAPLGNFVDTYSQSNRAGIRTSRPLWEGARIDINWSVGWSYNSNRTIFTDSSGVPQERSKVISGDVDRSYLTFPPGFVFSFFKTGIVEVNKAYEESLLDPNDTRSKNEKLSAAFSEGMEALPVFTQLIGSLWPRPNWTFRWDGLEKLPLFGLIAQRVSLDHSYTSTYRRRWKDTQGSGEVTESEQVSYGFAPLLGLTFTFKPLGKGTFGASFRLSTTSSFDLTPSALSIIQSSTTDISLSANYQRQGFEIPFFGLSLSNDIEINFSYSVSNNQRTIFDFKKDFQKDGQPLEGTVRTLMEPRIRYILSSRVTASVYYRYTRLKPGEGGSRIAGSTVNEGGLDVRVSIQ